MVKYRAVLFDLDGTLINSFPNYAKVMKITLAHFGYRVHQKRLRTTFPMTASQALATLGIPTKAWGPMEADYEAVRQRLKLKPVLFSGIRLMLNRLERTLFPALGIVTSGGDDEIAAMNRNFQFMKRIWVTVDADNVSAHKPAPEPLLDAIEQMGSSPNDALYVGDDPVDLATARNSQVDFGAAGWSANSRSDFKRAQYYFKSPLDLLRLL